jgi:predicted transcriptional regulator
MYSKIEKILLEKKISLYELAVSCSIPFSTIYSWKEKGTILNGKNIIKVSAYLGINPSAML